MADFVQTNVNLTEEDVAYLDQMMVEDAYDNRSAWMRRLVRQEWMRRHLVPKMSIHPTLAPTAQENQE